jgi:hypothetical protein
MSRLVPPVRPCADPVPIDLPTDATPLATAEAILTAIARGQIGPTDGKVLMEIVTATAQLGQLAVLETRLAKLETARGT